MFGKQGNLIKTSSILCLSQRVCDGNNDGGQEQQHREKKWWLPENTTSKNNSVDVVAVVVDVVSYAWVATYTVVHSLNLMYSMCDFYINTQFSVNNWVYWVHLPESHTNSVELCIGFLFHILYLMFATPQVSDVCTTNHVTRDSSLVRMGIARINTITTGLYSGRLAVIQTNFVSIKFMIPVRLIKFDGFFRKKKVEFFYSILILKTLRYLRLREWSWYRWKNRILLLVLFSSL